MSTTEKTRYYTIIIFYHPPGSLPRQVKWRNIRFDRPGVWKGTCVAIKKCYPSVDHVNIYRPDGSFDQQLKAVDLG